MLNDTETRQVLDALSANRVMAKDAAGNYTREVTPKRITDAIALCEASLARAVEPVVRYEPERYDEDRVRMALDSDGDWVRYSDYLIAFATPQAAAQPPAPGEAAREYMTGYSDGREWAQPSQAVEISDEEQVALLRFNETCEDGQGYDVKTSMMSRLAEIGVVSRKFGSVYFVTEYGQRVIAAIKQGCQHD